MIKIILSLLMLVNLTSAQQRQPDRGFQFANSYAAGNIDAVNVNNGNVVVNLPIASLPAGRGTSPGFSVTLQYNSKLWDSKQTTHTNALQQGNGDPNDTSGYYSYSSNELLLSDRGGWKMLTSFNIIETNRMNLEDPDPCLRGDPVDKLSARWKLEMEFPDGSVRQFIPVNYANKTLESYYNVDSNGLSYTAITQTNPANGLCYPVVNTNQATTAGMNYMTTDGSRLRLFIPYQPSKVIQERNWKIYSPDGTVIENNPPDDLTVGQRITDRNGSNVEIKGNQIIDDLGRSITISGNGITVSGVGGEPITTQIVGGYKWVHRKYKSIYGDQSVPSGTDDSAEVNVQIYVVEQVVLPSQAGGQSYTFDYNASNNQQFGTDYTDGWGELKSVTFPTNAQTTYTYEALDGINQTAEEILEHRVNQKDLTYTDVDDGVSTPQTQTTLYSTNNSVALVKNPDGSYSGETFIYHSLGRQWDSGLTIRSSTPNSTTERIWQRNLPYYTGNPYPYAYMTPGNANAYVKTEFTTIYDAANQPFLTAIKDFNYDKNGNITKITEYDWVDYNSVPRSYNKPTGIPAGAVKKRITVNQYYNQTPDADSTASSPYTYENPNAPKLKNVLQSTEIQNANGTPVARSEFIYDDPNNKGNLIGTKTWDSSKGGYSNPLSTGNSVSASMTYDSYGNPTLITDAKGNQTYITYGAINGYAGLYPTQTETAYGTSVERTSVASYDFYTGLVTSATDVDNNVTSATEYDALGRPVRSKAAVNTANEVWTQVEYDDLDRRVITRGDLFAVGDGKAVSIAHYDQLGRVRLARSLENATTEDAYNEADGIKVLTRYKTANPYSYAVTSNPYRAATSVQAGGEATMGWTRSKSWNTGRRGETETFSGAALPAPWGSNGNSTGMVVTETDANAAIVTDQTGKQRRSITNALGQLTRVDEPDATGNLGSISSPTQATYYSYDTLNNLTTVSQGVQTRTFAYNSLSRLLTATNPEAGTISYVYDNNGNLTSKTDARSVVTSYSYDNLNRVLTRSYNDGTPNVTYTYDNLPNAKGLLTKVSSSISQTEYTAFDNLGRVLTHKQTTNGTAYTTGYTYNLSGALIEETYPSGRVVKNTLDNDGRLSNVETRTATGAFQTRANSFNYTSAGAVGAMKLGNNRWESTQFNNRLQPTQIALGTSQNNTDLLKLDYSYGTTNNNGNVLSQTITVPTSGGSSGFTAVQNYSYDSLNRIKNATETVSGVQTWKQTFDYDRYGNRNFDAANTTTISGCPTAQCNPTINISNNRFNSGQGYTYDLSGNIVSDAEGRTFIYDAENKQKEVKNASNVTVGNYYYDGDGKRIKKVTASEEIVFVYDAGGKLVAEYSSQTPQTQATTRYLTQDHLGSPRIITDQSGAVLSRRDFAPFGEELYTGTGNRATGHGYTYGDSTRQKFATYQRDEETALDFAQARYYSNQLGRFHSVDPENYGANEDDPQSWNGYGYGRNNPTLYTDPDGLEYKICNTQGECVTQDDSIFKAAQKKLRRLFRETARDGNYDSGNILNEDGSRLGTYERISIDREYQFVYSISEQSKKKGKVVLGVAAVGVAVGTGVGVGAGTVGIVGARFLAQRLAVSILGRGQLARTISKSQTKLLGKLFGAGMAGARRALANPKVSQVLTNESLITYREIAKRVIAEGLDKGGQQAVRIEVIEKVLLQRGVILPK
jgi:RHS repeat-associated protein